MKILVFIIGTRPELIKLTSVIKHLHANQKIKPIVLFTGQHKQLTNLDFHGELPPILWVCLPPNPSTTNTLAVLQSFYIKEITSYLGFLKMSQVQHPLGNLPPIAGVVVQGDTTSAFCGALAAFNRGIPVHHVEAGLRTHDLNAPHPEEGYRAMITQIAKYHYCPTKANYINVLTELSQKELTCEVYTTGNPGLDNLDPTGCSYNDEVIITLHRHENRPNLPEWFEALEKITALDKVGNALTSSNPLKFLFYSHPNPDVQKHYCHFKHIKPLPPLPHDQFIQKLKQCLFIISASGGIQEEACFFNKKVIVCRTSTERPEGIVSGHLVMCPSPDQLLSIFKQVNADYKIDSYCPFGNGYCGPVIANLMEKSCLA